MADDKKPTDPHKDKIRQYSPNLSGHTYRCAICLKDCPPCAPDNVTLIPVCHSCWEKISPTNKLTIVSFFRNCEAMGRIANCMREYTDRKSFFGRGDSDSN